MFDFLDAHMKEVNENPLPPELFMALLNIGEEAYSGKRRAFPPDIERFVDPPTQPTFALTDIPENQMGMSIVQECRRRFPREKASAIAMSYLTRFRGISRTEDAGRVKQYIRRLGNGQVSINEALFRAAAECPMTRDGVFDSSYEDRIKAIIAAEDAEGEK